MKYQIEIHLFASLFSIIIGWFAYRKKSVSVSGLIALIIISQTIIWIDKIALLCILFYMFASCSALSRLCKNVNYEIENVVSKSGPRDYVQALANLGIGTLCTLGYKLSSNPLWIVALTGSVATGNADSWASEIGSLSKQLPISIINFKPLLKGVSGGITLTGTLGGFAGALFISIASILTLQLFEDEYFKGLTFVISTCFAGFAGMLFDSIIGAHFQALYLDRSSLRETENAQGNELIKGFQWLNNDLVNFISTLFGGVLSVIIYLCIIKLTLILR